MNTRWKVLPRYDSRERRRGLMDRKCRDMTGERKKVNIRKFVQGSTAQNVK